MIGFFIKTDEAAAVRKVYANIEDPGAPRVTNNIFEISPRYGLRVMTTLQNADLDPEEHAALERLVTRLADYLGKHHRDVLFEPPLPAAQASLFDYRSRVEEQIANGTAVLDAVLDEHLIDEDDPDDSEE